MLLEDPASLAFLFHDNFDKVMGAERMISKGDG